MKKNMIFKLSLVLCLLISSVALAAPTLDGLSGTHRTNSAKNLGHLRFSAGITGNGSVGANKIKDKTFYRMLYRAHPDSLADYATRYNTVVRVPGSDSLISSENVEVTEITDITSHLVLALGITDYFDIGVGLPFYYDNITSFEAENNPDLKGVSGFGIGDLVISGRLGYPTYKHESAWKMALIGKLTIPTGDSKKGFLPKKLYYIPKDSTTLTRFWSAGLPSLSLIWANTVDFQEIKETVEVLWHMNIGMQATASELLDNSFLFSTSIEYWANPVFGLFAEFSGETRMSNFEDGYSLGDDPLYLSPGAMIRTKGWNLTLAADFGLSRDGSETLILDASEGPAANDPLCPNCTGDGKYTVYTVNPTPNFGLSATISWTGYLKHPDKDGDEIVDKEDACPEDPEDYDGFEDFDGCPEADNDNDGVLDSLDECPNQPEDFDGFEDEDGCPDFDNDRDSILDINDKCPNDPEDYNGYEDKDGCPDGEKDTDGDGIPDSHDKCPNDPEDMDGYQDTDGCPEPDNDGDGILDVNDKCPNVPEDFNGFEDEDGCPDGDRDTDKDKILDMNDKCPFDPEDYNGYEDEDGCPDNMKDRDGDGIPDSRDKCPDDPEDKDGFQDEDGCPDPDNDLDGIPDAMDKCPNKPESFNGFQDEDGCPDKAPPPPKKIVLHGVYFETGSSDLLDESFEKLDQVALTLKDNPKVSIEISGHTDSRGSMRLNQKLSEERAHSVVNYLVSQGVDKKQLKFRGYGAEKPVASNRTAKGRAKNRRIEMRRLN